MKYINIFFIILILFAGCAKQQEQIIEVDVTKPNIKDKDQKISFFEENGVIKVRKSYQEKVDKVPLKEELGQQEAEEGFNIAVIFPSQIVGKYAVDGVNSIISYLLHKDVEFQLNTYDCVNEMSENITKIPQNIDLKKYKHIVLFVTKDGLTEFIKLEDTKHLKIYAPLINKNDVLIDNENIVFGGIDYNKQFEVLNTLLSDDDNLSEFHDSVSLGQILSYKLDKLHALDYKFQKRLKRNNVDYESFLKENTLIQNTTIFLNTPIVQTSILLSQMRAYEVEYQKLLSTQINYTPLILSLTQVDDRKNMIIANSIGQTDEKLMEYGAILNTDFKYNWVNFSTLVGIDYLLNDRYGVQREFTNKIIDNQVEFEISLYETGYYSFKPYRVVLNEDQNSSAILDPVSE